MSEPHYAIFRVQRLKSREDLDGATRHGRREDTGTHFDPERTPWNWHWGATRVDGAIDWGRGVDTALVRLDARCRRGSPLAAEILVSASPDYFLPDTQDGHFDMNKVAKWAEANMAVFYKRFGKAVVGARLDLDEGSPHMAICVVPVYEKTTRHTKKTVVSFRKVFGGESKEEARARMIGWQDWYAGEMAPFGLSRGVHKSLTGRRHLSHQQYAREKKRKDDELDCALQRAREFEAKAAAELAAAGAQAARLEAVAHQHARQATEVLLQAEKARDYFYKTVALLEEHAPDTEIFKALKASAPTLGAWESRIDRIREEISTLPVAAASKKK